MLMVALTNVWGLTVLMVALTNVWGLTVLMVALTNVWGPDCVNGCIYKYLGTWLSKWLH